jgi:hypothetical protein
VTPVRGLEDDLLVRVDHDTVDADGADIDSGMQPAGGWVLTVVRCLHGCSPLQSELDLRSPQEQTAYQAAVAINVRVRKRVPVGVQPPIIMRKGELPEEPVGDRDRANPPHQPANAPWEGCNRY